MFGALKNESRIGRVTRDVFLNYINKFELIFPVFLPIVLLDKKQIAPNR